MAKIIQSLYYFKRSVPRLFKCLCCANLTIFFIAKGYYCSIIHLPAPICSCYILVLESAHCNKLLTEWRGKKRPSDAFVNYCWRKKKKYPSCRKCCLAPQNCSKSTKWKCSLQEPGHHLRMEYERAVRIGPKSDS